MITKSLSKSKYCSDSETNGISLTELLVAMAILGILSSIALPNYMNQMRRTRQREAETIVSQVMIQVAAHSDEYGVNAQGWDNLDDITAVMTDTGTASGTTFSTITLPGGNYSLDIKGPAGNDYIVTATPTDTNSSTFNVLGCINVSTGASNIQAGDSTTAAVEADLTCP